MTIHGFHASTRKLWMRSGFIAAVLLIVLAVGTGAWLWLDRVRTLDAAERSTRALVRVLAEQTAQGLQAFDLTLAGIIDVLALTSELGEHNPAFENTMRERLKVLPLVRAITVIDPDGFITQDTDPPHTPRINYADRDYFRGHAADPGLAVRIGRPLISRTMGGWFISVSRRINRPDGSFGGVAIAGIEPRYFEGFYRELDLGKYYSIDLFRRDGILLARIPYQAETMGKDYSARDLFQKHLPVKADGTYRGPSLIDDTPLIVSYRSVTGYPLVVAVGVVEDALLAGWWRNAAVTTGTAGLAAILIILLHTLWVQRQTEREQARQHQIQAREQSVRAALKMATVLESTTDAVLEVDRDWRVTFMNERARTLLPDRRDLTGQVIWEAYPQLVGTDLWQRCHEIMDANAPSEFETIGPLTGRWLFSRVFPSRDGLAVFSQDIMARKQAEQDRERLARELEEERTLLKGMLAQLPAGVIAAAAPAGRILLQNATAERLLGHCLHITQSVDDYAAYSAIHPDGSPYRPEEYPLVRAMHDETVVQEEMLYRRGDGSLTTFIVSAAPVRDPDGRTVIAVTTFHDISERKRMEEDLRAAKQEAERANLSKSKFLAAASHDLRQPLQSLFLFAAALHAQVQTERGRKALDTLERNLEALKGLLDSLLDVSRLDADVIRPTLEDFLVDPVLDQIGASFAPVARAKGLDFEVDIVCDLPVHSDRLLLGRMVRNLVENAIKYTEQGSVRLECRIVGDHASIAVHDTGIGIAFDQQEAIFVEFHQVGNPERDRAKGLGLGLSIVQRLAKLLDHPVSVRSTPGRGSVFTVDVPLGATDAVRSPEPLATTAPDGGGRLAVLIDDEVDVLLGLQGIFRDWGYDTVGGTSAEQALERLQADGRTPVVIVSDYQLGENLTGVEAVRLVQQQVGAAVPGVILTGDTGPELRAEVARQGLGIVIKPVAPCQLHEALKRLLGVAA